MSIEKNNDERGEGSVHSPALSSVDSRGGETSAFSAFLAQGYAASANSRLKPQRLLKRLV